MQLNEYQLYAQKTAIFPTIGGSRFVYPALGLAGESGEVLEKIKKLFRDYGGVISEEYRVLLKKELGDVLWYVAVLSLEVGLTLEEVAQDNIDKLADRQRRGVIGGSGDMR